MRYIIRNGRVIDPAQQLDRVTSILIQDGRIAAWDVGDVADAELIDASERLVVPGLIDAYAELREPGFEEDETILAGTASAVAGGFATIACISSTDPPIDSQAGVQFVLQKAAQANRCNVHVIACVSKNKDGQELAEIGGLVEAGAVAFSDADRSIQNAELLRRALQYCLMFDKPVFNYPDVEVLSRDGIIHEGETSLVLGLSAIPSAAEDVMTGRDLRLAEATGGRLHLANISSAGSVDLLRRFKTRGTNVTAGCSAVHFALTDTCLRSFDSRFKVRPPLRSSDDVQHCIAGLADGTLDVITSGHSPRAPEKKVRELDLAPFGMAGFETTLGLVTTYLVRPGHLTWLQAIEKLTTNPARLLGLDRGTLQVGAVADVTIVDPHVQWTVDPAAFAGKSHSTPLAGETLFGRADYTLVSGQIRFARNSR